MLVRHDDAGLASMVGIYDHSSLDGGQLPASRKRKQPFRHEKQVFKRVRTNLLRVAEGGSGSTFEKALLRGVSANATDLASLEEVKYKHSKADTVLIIAKSEQLLNAAKYQLRLDFYAANTVLSYQSEVELFVKTMEARGSEPFPLTIKKIEEFAACLKSADYGSAVCYLSAVVSTNKLLGFELTPGEWFQYKRIRKALEVGTGGEHRMQPLNFEKLKQVDVSAELMFYGCLAVVCSFFLLRGEEIREMRGLCRIVNCSSCDCHVHLCPELSRVTVRIASDKTNWVEKDCIRAVECCCGDDAVDCNGVRRRIPICPVHALVELRSRSCLHLDDATWRVAQGKCKEPVSYKALLEGTRSIAKLSGEELLDKEGRHRFGTHSFRRTGAIALALAGWSLELVMLWGRWGSSAIRAYVADAPLRSAVLRAGWAVVKGLMSPCAKYQVRSLSHV